MEKLRHFLYSKLGSQVSLIQRSVANKQVRWYTEFEIVGELKKPNWNTTRDHWVVIYVDGKKVAETEKRTILRPRWQGSYEM